MGKPFNGDIIQGRILIKKIRYLMQLVVFILLHILSSKKTRIFSFNKQTFCPACSYFLNSTLPARLFHPCLSSRKVGGSYTGSYTRHLNEWLTLIKRGKICHAFILVTFCLLYFWLLLYNIAYISNILYYTYFQRA